MAHIQIYQIKKEQSRNFGFMSYDMGKRLNGRAVTKDDYDLAYDADLPIVTDHSLNDLDEIFEMFNINRPDDFKGHSLSVSDVVRVDDGGYWFCNSFGWHLLDW